MAKEVLLDSDIDAGKNLLKALDENGFNITTAMWFYYSDIEEWKLLLSSPDFNKIKDPNEPSRIYTKISQIINDSKDVAITPLESVKILLKNDPLIKLFGFIISAKGISAIRMKANYLNGIYVEDALIYRNIK